MAVSILDSIGNTPLLTLNNFGKDSGAHLFGKQESRNPMGSVKCRLAAALIAAGEAEGKIGPNTTIIEPTSGNTGIGLAFVCAHKKLPLILTMPESMSIERRKLLSHLGAKLVLTPAASGMKGAISKAEELVAELADSFMPNQFGNPANPDIHRRTTALEILRDAPGSVDIFVAGVGTGGTLTGVSEVLKEKFPNMKVVAVEPVDSPVLSGGSPGPHKLQGIGAGFVPSILNREIIDEVFQVSTEQALTAARELARLEGVSCGISSGAAAFAAKSVASRVENAGKNVVFIIPDTGERYLSTDLFSE